MSASRAPGDDFDAAIYAEATVRIALEAQPRLVMVGHSVNGMGYGPAAAVRLGGSFVSDAFAVEADGGRLAACAAATATRSSPGSTSAVIRSAR